MNHQLLFAAGIEVLFMVASFFLLSQSGTEALYRWGGTVVLCLTFCWSVVLGCVLVLNDISFRI